MCIRDSLYPVHLGRHWVSMLTQVDHMFSPNHWDSFCSELWQDVSCVALLLVGHATCLLHRLQLVLLIISMHLLAGIVPGWEA